MASTTTDSLTEGCKAIKRGLSSAPPGDTHLRWDAEGVEELQSDEQLISEQITAIHGPHTKHKHRHVKTQGLVQKAPSQCRRISRAIFGQGLFGTSGMYDVAARYANEPVLIQADQESGPCGLAMRIFGVKGERLEGVDASVSPQGLPFDNAPMLELTDVKSRLETTEFREKSFDDSAAMSPHLKLRTDGH